MFLPQPTDKDKVWTPLRENVMIRKKITARCVCVCENCTVYACMHTHVYVYACTVCNVCVATTIFGRQYGKTVIYTRAGDCEGIFSSTPITYLLCLFFFAL